jgi:hypothetical protein
VTIERIRRTIRGSIVADKTVLVDLEGTGITAPQAAAIMAGWDAAAVKACGCNHTLPYPLPEDVRIGVIQSDQSGTSDRRRRRSLGEEGGQ